MRGILRGMQSRRGVAALAWLAVTAWICLSGCRTTTRSGLPEHINSVEVHIFQNKTMYKSLEAYVTRRLIDRINGDPSIRVLSSGGDAVLTGEITSVEQATVRETTTGEPGTIIITINAVFSLYDAVEGRFIIENKAVSSNSSVPSAGIYEPNRKGSSQEATEMSASAALADEIIRRSIGMW